MPDDVEPGLHSTRALVVRMIAAEAIKGFVQYPPIRA
jgi:hypothetical protein